MNIIRIVLLPVTYKIKPLSHFLAICIACVLVLNIDDIYIQSLWDIIFLGVESALMRQTEEAQAMVETIITR